MGLRTNILCPGAHFIVRCIFLVPTHAKYEENEDNMKKMKTKQTMKKKWP